MKNAALVLFVLLAAVTICKASPARLQRRGRQTDDTGNSIDSDVTPSDTSEVNPAATLPPLDTRPPADLDSSEESDKTASSSSTNGSNLFSLLNLVGQLFPGSNGSNVRVRRLFKNFIMKNERAINSMEKYINRQLIPPRRRQDVSDNEIEIEEDISNVSSAESSEEQKSDEQSNQNSDESQSDDKKSIEKKSEERKSQEEDNKATEESVENGNAKQSEEDKGSADSDYEEPPGGGDGEGGGILGIIAGLSGGEDGQSDLGSLLATVSGIVVNLSGDGIDVNGLIASGLGLFVGLLSEGMENPGSIVASYINTALDTISGGGSKNNGAFFGSFLSKLLKGISAAPEGSEEGSGGGSDSAGFFLSLLMGLSGSSSGKGMPVEEI